MSDTIVHVVEPLCGTAAFSRALAGRLKSPTSYAGSKDAFVDVLIRLACIKLEQVREITLNDKGLYGTIWCALLQDATRVADILEERLAPSERLGEALWHTLKDHLRSDKHASCDMSIFEHAAMYLAYLSGAYGSMEKTGFRGRHKDRPNDTGFVPHLTSICERLRDFADAISHKNDITWHVSTVDASILLDTFQSSCHGARIVCFIDPPYDASGNCYFSEFSRAQVLALAEDWSTRVPNCTVMICEAEPLDKALNDLTFHRHGIEWRSVDITDERHGHCRRQTTCQARGLREYVTMTVSHV